MVDFLLLAVGVFSLGFQIFASYLAYRIYKFNRLSSWWLILLSAFELEALRRVLLVINDISLTQVPLEIAIDRTLMFSVSLFICVGLWSMLKNFESFDFLEKKVKDKAKSFKK